MEITDRTSAQTARPSSRRVDRFLNMAVLCSGAALLGVTYGPALAGEINTSPPVHHFGRVAAGTLVRHKFVLRNVRPYPVTITKIAGGCGCTEAFPGRKLPVRLAPLESVTLVASLDTAAKSGVVSQNVYLFGKNEKPLAKVALHGFVGSVPSPAASNSNPAR